MGGRRKGPACRDIPYSLVGRSPQVCGYGQNHGEPSLTSLRTEAWRICVAAAGGTGVHASLFDATAVLIAMVTLSQLPIGPSVGAAGVDRLRTLRVAPVPVRAAEG
jgi:hypothetical protein